MDRRSAQITLDSTKLDPLVLKAIEDILYGTPGTPARLPLPGELFTLIRSGRALIEDISDEGTYIILLDSLIEDPADPGTYLIMKPGLYEDPSDPGTYWNGVS